MHELFNHKVRTFFYITYQQNYLLATHHKSLSPWMFRWIFASIMHLWQSHYMSYSYKE